MTKPLKALHLIVVLVLIIYLGKGLARYGIKLLNPSSDGVRFWHPGGELMMIGLGFALLLGIACCTLSLVKRCSLPLSVSFHTGWLVCLTWIGWFGADAPFRLHELVGVDLADSAAIGRLENQHLGESLAVYAGIALITSLPLLMRLSGQTRPNTGSTGAERRRAR
jgi:hypothetical protein